MTRKREDSRDLVNYSMAFPPFKLHFRFFHFLDRNGVQTCVVTMKKYKRGKEEKEPLFGTSYFSSPMIFLYVPQQTASVQFIHFKVLDSERSIRNLKKSQYFTVHSFVSIFFPKWLYLRNEST